MKCQPTEKKTKNIESGKKKGKRKQETIMNEPASTIL